MKIEELNLSALKYFFDTVESQSLTKAAELNFVTRSAVSQAIARLELWSGSRLTTHEKKTFRLTESGEDFYRRMKKSFTQFKDLIETTSEGVASIRVGCSMSLVDTFLLPNIRRLEPLTALKISTGTSTQLIHKLEEGEINLALFVGDQTPGQKNEIVLSSGQFVLASRNGEMSSQIITTETRAEVLELRRYLVTNKSLTDRTFLTIESWTLAAKLARELNMTCLVPDFLLSPTLKKVQVRSYNCRYKVILKHTARPLLSKTEIDFIQAISK